MGKCDENGSGMGEAMQLAAAKQQYAEHMDSLRAEGLLDDQFSELQQLQDESSPDFVEEVVLLFIQDSGRIIKNLTESLIGAQRVKAVCIKLRMCCNRQDQLGCLFALEHVTREFEVIKGKLQTMLELEKQIVALGGTPPPFTDKL
ncbi:hypothetical protein BDL97_02G070500 [Sphagnum fallax]|nr:hypothetical protein BDL97_02G070500 [Sphagnum fallax]